MPGAVAGISFNATDSPEYVSKAAVGIPANSDNNVGYSFSVSVLDSLVSDHDHDFICPVIYIRVFLKWFYFPPELPYNKL